MVSEDEIAKLVARAEALEKKQLFVKAAECYLKAGMKDKAAGAYEAGYAFKEAEGLYLELNRPEDAERCRKKGSETSTGTWSDEQARFQREWGNPY